MISLSNGYNFFFNKIHLVNSNFSIGFMLNIQLDLCKIFLLLHVLVDFNRSNYKNNFHVMRLKRKQFRMIGRSTRLHCMWPSIWLLCHVPNWPFNRVAQFQVLPRTVFGNPLVFMVRHLHASVYVWKTSTSLLFPLPISIIHCEIISVT